MLREVGGTLHRVMVAVTWGRHVRFQMQPRVTSVVSFSPYCNNYVPNSVSACLRCTS